MFVLFMNAAGDDVVVNATLVLTADDNAGGVTLRMVNGETVSVQGALRDVFERLGNVRLS